MKTWVKILIIIALIAFPCLASSSQQRESGRYTLSLKLTPAETIPYEGGIALAQIDEGKSAKEYCLKKGPHLLVFKAKGYIDKFLYLDIRKNQSIEDKLERAGSHMRLVASFPCGGQPKSVLFSPDGNYLFTALLSGYGVEVYRVGSYKKIATLSPPKKYNRSQSFVELAIRQDRNELWVSQMTEGCVHVFDLKRLRYKRTISVGGRWTKVLKFSPDNSLLLASNWESWDVSVIDANAYSLLGTIKTTGTPRGLCFLADPNFVYASNYDRCAIDVLDIGARKKIRSIDLGEGAMRHLVADYKRGFLYASDMARAKIYKISLETEKVVGSVDVDYDPNTICLSPDGTWLYVSSRGPNGPDGYLYKGLVFGKFQRIATDTMEVVDWAWGKNQPTGLDVSPDGHLVAFSDFLDNDIEIYKIED